MNKSITLSRKQCFRFFASVDVKDENECWNWTASLNTCGYGKYPINRTTYMAHRISWMMANGDIPEGLYVLHKCDNRRCVNPNHLFLGTVQENADDRVRKLRGSRGERNHSKLKEKDVLEIRKLLKNGCTLKSLSTEYNVSTTTVYRIGARRKWSWLE